MINFVNISLLLNVLLLLTLIKYRPRPSIVLGDLSCLLHGIDDDRLRLLLCQVIDAYRLHGSIRDQPLDHVGYHDLVGLFHSDLGRDIVNPGSPLVLHLFQPLGLPLRFP